MELAKQMEEEYENYLTDMESNRDISNTDSLVANVPDHDSYFLVRNLGTININTEITLI